MRAWNQRLALGTAAVAALVAYASAQVRPAACSAGAAVTFEIESEFCGESMGSDSILAAVDTCCANAGINDDDDGDEVRRMLGIPRRSLQTEDAQCRTVASQGAYCDVELNEKGDCEGLIGETSMMNIYLDLQTAEEQDACCQSCSCFGDPECVAFDGTRDEWVICDGRRGDTCLMSKTVCGRQRDHEGRKCRWIKDDPEMWTSWDESGSPCQAKWEKSGYPSMTMYETTDGTTITLELGERGVINSINMTEPDGGIYVLESNACFENEGAGVWGTSAVPSSWTSSSPNELEIWWHTANSQTGLYMDVVCTRVAASGRTRLNIERLVETNPIRAEESSGFCSSGSIGEKSGTTENTNWMRESCLRRNMPGLKRVCRNIVSRECGPDVYDPYIQSWCDTADLSATVAETPENCFQMLTDDALTEDERAVLWIEMICACNGLTDFRCMTEISQFGIKPFFESHSTCTEQTEPPAVETCANSVDEYSVNDDACQSGVSIEYRKDDEWIQAFFVPSSHKPCGNNIVVYGNQYPELFLYPVRFAQCDLSTDCLMTNSCTAAAGFSTQVSFQTSVCPTPAPTTSPTDSPTQSPTKSPTTSPTDTPTVSPTTSPTKSPTTSPTVSPTLNPTSSPTHCVTTLEPGTESLNSQIIDEYHFSFELELEDCSEPGSNVFHVGCDGDTILRLDVLSCTELEMLFVEANGDQHVCQFDIGIANHVEGTIIMQPGAEKNANLLIDGVLQDGCQFDMSSGPKTSNGEETCVYTSAPGVPAANACLNGVNIVLNPQASDCFQCTELENQQTICEPRDEPAQFGTCHSCCTDESFVSLEDVQCRELTMPEPFCDKNGENGGKCSKLKNNGGTLTINLGLDDASDIQCCKSCVCYGDPECVAFDNSEDKWILCDARDTECIVNEDICTSQKDHMGTTCKWDSEIGEAVSKRRSDLAALGSPCQPDWESSGPAYMTMYEIDDGFKARISMGERAVIETLELTTKYGMYTLVADKCFTDDEWETSPDSELALDAALIVTKTPTSDDDQVTLEIIDPNTEIFVRAVCIRHTSKNGKVTSYRMNVQNLVETNYERTGTGFCADTSAQIDKGSSTTANTEMVFETCQTGLEDNHLLCKALWNPSCTYAQVEEGVQSWCEQANLFPNDPDRVNTCIDYIGTSAAKWEQLYCDSISAARSASTSKVDWIKYCTSEMQTEGYDSFVSKHSQGTFSSSSVETHLCGIDETSYSTKASECTPGVSIEYLKDDGTWVEELFIPSNLPPCGGSLEITAKNHYKLFVKPIRVRQCEVDTTQCSVDLGCLPNYGMDVTYLFSHDDIGCADV